MSCPSCGYLFQKLSVTTNSGGRFDIEHCGRCGGTWFDPYEINRIPYHEVARIAHLTVLPKKPPAELSIYKCPRCHKVLSSLTAESVPKGIKLLRCPKCHGIWATQKTLETFKTYQEETVNEYKRRNIAFPSLSVVLVPALFVIFLFFATFFTISNLDKTREERIYASEQVRNVTVTPISKTSVGLTFTTKIPLKSSISFGESTLEFVFKNISSLPSTKHGVFLTDLKPNTNYFYRITLEDEKGQSFTTETQTFNTTR